MSASNQFIPKSSMSCVNDSRSIDYQMKLDDLLSSLRQADVLHSELSLLVRAFVEFMCVYFLLKYNFFGEGKRNCVNSTTRFAQFKNGINY